MKLYDVYVEEYSNNEFDSVLVVAADEQSALRLVATGYFGKSYFKPHQGTPKIKQIDLKKEQVVYASFNEV